MIPADHISFNDDGTAWLVVEANDDLEVGLLKINDRPCDCGEGVFGGWADPNCSDCDGTGRYTFTIEVLYDERWNSVVQGFPVRTYRVSVIPGMVLPITDYGTNLGRGQTYPFITLNDGRAVLHYIPRAMAERRTITLPPAAAPGQWAVKLKVAQ